MSRRAVVEVPWRVNLLLEGVDKQAVELFLKERGVSMSQWVREQLKQAVQLHARLSVPRPDALH